MSMASRTPTFVLLGVVLLAAVLLIAGYGLAVGVGLIAGLLLGLTVFLGFLAMNPRSRSNGVFGTWNGGAGSAVEPAMAPIERHVRDSMRVAGVDDAALRRVIALGDVVDSGGVRVELIALEIREDGCVAILVAHTRPPVGSVGHFIDVTVSDESGTAYVASGQGSGGSGPGTSRQEIRFAPAPPETARTLILRIEAFVDPFPGRAVEQRGPWEFRVAL
ncbi:MAG TPA: hypothetical protein VID26_02450 [Candidatus Limnocylindrales bacterium]